MFTYSRILPPGVRQLTNDPAVASRSASSTSHRASARCSDREYLERWER